MNKKKKVEKLLILLSRLYRHLAILFLNTIILLLIVNAIAYGVIESGIFSRENPQIEKYGFALVEAAYTHLDEGEIRGLLHETWNRPLQYEPYTQLKEREFRGKFVNVDRYGFRRIKDPCAWPPDPESLNVFVFGGSTTFGYGVADNETISSYLQEILRTHLGSKVCVYNFGRANYYSTQERILYEEILSSGTVPDIVVFIDGLNEFLFATEWPDYSEQISDLIGEPGTIEMEERGGWQVVIDHLLSQTSLGTVIRKAGARLDAILPKREHRENRETGAFDPDTRTGGDAERSIERYLANKAIIEGVSDSFDISCFFVWQPIPNYHYNLEYHPFSRKGFDVIEKSGIGYRRMEKMKHEISPVNFIWCADLLEEAGEGMFVDLVHYSSILSRSIAEIIGNKIVADRGRRHPGAVAPQERENDR